MNEQSRNSANESRRIILVGIEELEQITFNLDLLNHIVSYSTFINVVSTLILLGFARFVEKESLSIELFGLKLSLFVVVIPLILLALFTIGLLFIHDNKRRQGDSLFGEISDKMQLLKIIGNTGTDNSNPQSSNEIQFESKVRDKLRIFAQKENLPLFTNKVGPAVYSAINILVVLCLAILNRLI